MASSHGPPRLARPLLRFPERQRSEPEGAPGSSPCKRSDAAHPTAGQHRHLGRWRSATVPEEAAEELHQLVFVPGEEVQHLDLRPGEEFRPAGATVRVSVSSNLG